MGHGNTGIGERLKMIRLLRDKTLAFVSLETGISQGALSDYERGEKIPGGEAVVKLANCYGVTCDYILGTRDGRYGEYLDCIPKITFAERFSLLCIGKTQQEIADAIGVSRATVGYYQSGSRSPDVVILAKIAEHFGVTTDYLVGLSNSPTLHTYSPELAEGLQAVLEEIAALAQFRANRMKKAKKEES